MEYNYANTITYSGISLYLFDNNEMRGSVVTFTNKMTLYFVEHVFFNEI